VFYGWVVAGSGFLISAVGLGARYSYGVFLKTIEAEFAMTRVAASSIFSFYMLLCCLTAILGGWCVDRYGPKKVGLLMGTFTGLSFLLTSQANATWQLFITYSFIFSLGTGAVYAVTNTTASRWFVKKRGFVLGLTSSGGGVGTVFTAPVATYLIAAFNWRTAFVVLGFSSWIVIAAMSFLLKKGPQDIGLLPDGLKSEPPEATGERKAAGVLLTGFSLGQAYKMSQFWLLGFSWLFVSFSMHMVFVHIVPYAIGVGVSPMDASFVLSLLGFANILGRVVSGRLSDNFGRKPLSIICALVQIAALLWLIGARHLWMLYAFALAFGFTFGGYSTLITIFVGDIFGMRSLGAIMGILTAGFALGAAIGPAAGGYVFDVSGNYVSAFASGIISIFIAACLIAAIRNVSAFPLRNGKC
jgi:MFS family permease